jgi:hypothetical protein
MRAITGRLTINNWVNINICKSECNEVDPNEDGCAEEPPHAIYAAYVLKPCYGKNVNQCLCSRKKAMQVAQLCLQKVEKDGC